MKRSSSKAKSRGGDDRTDPSVRIIGGSMRGRSIPYLGDLRTRPMKDRVREAVFNLLADSVVGLHAIDLFAGTGALGFEALSRGAARATFIERHVPTARSIRDTVAHLQLESRAEVISSDAFFWLRHDWQPGTTPLVLFCSPPYEFYVSRVTEMCELWAHFLAHAPPRSRLVVESDERFDVRQVIPDLPWMVRDYPPAVIALATLPSE